MPNGAKNRRSLIFLSLALSTTGLLLTIALVSRSDYFTSSEPTKKPTHQYTNRVHSVKNFTAAAQLMEKMPTIHPPSDIKSQTPNFSAFNPINSSNSSNNSNNSVAKTNATAATLNHPPSDIKSEDPAQLPFGFSSNSRNIEDSTNSPSIADNTTAG